MGLTGRLTVRKNTDVPTCIALFCIPHYTSLNIVYFSLEYCGVESKIETFRAPSIHTPKNQCLYRSYPSCVPDQTPFHIQFKSILPFAYVRDHLTVNGLWHACLGVIQSPPNLKDGFKLHVFRFCTMTEICKFRFSLLAAL